ncbi:hypothetical protein ENSA5_40540 [Enhygromyxa salina]|uniref:Uncharacterized protein n=1 Tax=Enhygromyxa salina TaxID=215803 RepID=A0A2S9XPW4_9BACT|nr:DUF5362 family protein [Enhygromyxa salina]PRP94731.1 hypothetical protein ENSA5_40540 [Enhygromyxa salina]
MSFNPYQPPTPAYDTSYTQQSPQAGGAVVTDRIVNSLRKTRPWVAFLAILGFIGSGITLLGGLGALVAASEVELGAGIGIAYLFVGAIYLIIALSLNRYATSISRLIHGGGVEELENAVDAQASFWQLAGIMTLIGMVLMVIMVVAAAAIGASVANSF